MGEIADAIINGDMDEVTGEWLGNGKGFPRSLYGNNTKSFDSNPVITVHNYLKQAGFDTVDKQAAILSEYSSIRKIDTIEKSYTIIRTDQASWKAFKKFVETKSK